MVIQSRGANPSQQRPDFQAGCLVNDCDPRPPQAQSGVPQPQGAQGNAPHRPVHWAQPEVRGGQPGVNPGYPDQSIPPQAIVPYQNPNQSNAGYGRPQCEPERDWNFHAVLLSQHCSDSTERGLHTHLQPW